jgi:phage regulator Rha-like protein
MAKTVEAREKMLLLQVEGLQIKIDRNRQAQDVKEIVDTDYFRELKKKAREFRQL